MVDPRLLVSDIVANAVGLALPGILWAFLFLLAWEHGPFAERLGFGRRAFWLLLPGSMLASFAILPFGAASNDLIAVSFGGAVFPILVGALALGRIAPPLSRTLSRFLLPLTVEGGLALAFVLPSTEPLATWLGRALGGGLDVGQALLVGIVALAVPSATAMLVDRERTPDRTGLFLLALTSGVLYVTFLASQAIPGVGIVEPFPLFLLPPIAAGVLAALVVRRALPGNEAAALPVAYVATTWGVLLGADLLRQPPLYGSGPAGLYTIGGAGVFDLVYLSGLLALLLAYLAHAALGRPIAVSADAAPPAGPTPLGRLGRAFRAGVRGELAVSLQESSRAGHEAAEQAHRLLDLPLPPPNRPWEGLPVPGWIVSDQANLDSLARSESSDGREGFRGWLTARSLVRLGRELGQRRFGSAGTRSVGFLVDLAIVGSPAIGVWAALVLLTPGNLVDVLGSLGFNAAIYGFIALAFLYRVLSETFTGSSPGKRAVGLVVRDRRLERVGFLPSLVRNVSVLPVLTVLGLGGALMVAFALKWGTFASVPVGGIDLPGGLLALSGIVAFLGGGIALLGAFGVLAISLSSERQRIGDVFAGTWVVRAAIPGAVPPGAAPAPGRSA